jgi:hypothetical protein
MKSPYIFVLHYGLPRSALCVVTKLLKLRACKTTVVHILLPPGCKARIRNCRWFQESVFNDLLHPELKFDSNKAWFTISKYVNS